jgi:hypothetical protein
MHFVTRVALAIALLCQIDGGALMAAANPSLTGLDNGIDRGETGNRAQELSIARLNATIKVHGRMAEVSLDAEIANAGTTEVEARFALTLPTDAVVTGYALDVGDRMIDGVLVDQPKARAVYENEIRKGIDPGLAEISGNVFQARIYPVSVRGSRRIIVRFVAPIDSAKGFTLPIETADPVGRFSVEVDAAGYRDAPKITLPISAELPLVRQAGVWHGAVADTRDRRLEGVLAVRGGAAAAPMLVSRHGNGRDYFQIEDGDEDRRPPTVDHTKIRIYWDNSRSRRDDLLDAEIKLVRAYIAASKADIIDLVSFTSGLPMVTRFTDAGALEDALAHMTYRGGTSYRDLDTLKLDPADQCLMFSDGTPTIDTDADFRPDCRLAIIASAADANSLKLGLLARASRGQYLRLTADNQPDILASLLRPTVTVVDVRDDSGRRLGFRSFAAPEGRWFVAGQMPDHGEVHLRIAGLRKGLVERIYSSQNDAAGRSDAAGALWAAERVQQLSANPADHERMREIALRHHVASPSMAFLVLERPAQYLDADITPPTGFSKQWLTDYAEAKSARESAKREARAERLQFVLAQWTERKAWWAEKFALQARPKKPYATPVSQVAPTLAPPIVSVPVAPAPVLAPSAPPPPPAQADAADDISEVIVTAQRVDGRTESVPLAISALGGRQSDGPAIDMKIEDVLSDQPYLKALDAASVTARRQVLAEEEARFGGLPAFYLETSEWFRAKGDPSLARTLLLSALELPASDDETRLIVAFRLQRDGRIDDAIRILEQMAATTDFRPQPKRSLALALAERGRGKGASGRADLERAFTLLTEVALTPTRDAFDGIETIALMEANALIPAIETAGGTWSLDKRLVALFDTDVRIVIEWTNDDADIDLWVIEPNGEKVFYANKQSAIGGLISDDMTDGYGPEEYVLHRAMPGQYRVKIDGFSPDRLNPNGKGRVMVRLIRDFARPAMKQSMIDADLSFERNNDKPDGGGKPIASMTVGKQGQ